MLLMVDTRSLCDVTVERSAGPCFSPIDPGTCDNVEKRFAFNVNTKRCQMFNYSGCGGNNNNFLRRRDCIVKCGRRQKGKASITSPLLPVHSISTKYDCDLQLFQLDGVKCTNFVFSCKISSWWDSSLKKLFSSIQSKCSIFTGQEITWLWTSWHCISRYICFAQF